MSNTQQIKYMPEGAIVTIEIGTGYYARLHRLFEHFVASHNKTIEEVNQSLEELKTREPQTRFEDGLMTILILIDEIGKQADQQKVMAVKEIDLDELAK